MAVARVVLFLVTLLTVGGCFAPRERLSFPTRPMQRADDTRTYDVDGNGRVDFRLRIDEHGTWDIIAYDDDEDGVDDRVFRLSSYAPEKVPHVILLLDSIPWSTVAKRHERGDWPWFDPPVKVIPPFPTMSGIIFSAIVHAPPLPGMINRYYDRRESGMNNLIVKRAFGAENPWHRRLDYGATYVENGQAFLEPRPWCAAEMSRAKRAVDADTDRVTIAYVASSSGMLSVFGEQGANEVLDWIEPFCMQLLYERQGALKISIMADHGHNYLPGKSFDLPKALSNAGFHVGKRLRNVDDVVMDIDGLVNYVGVHTKRPAEVAQVVAAQPEVQLAMHLQGERVIVRNSKGSAVVEQRGGRIRYTPIEADVLECASIAAKLTEEGQAESEGFIDPKSWFDATVDARFPDGPCRVWNAFHGLVVNPPDVMITLQDGYYTGLGFLELFVDMQSTHGGLDQINSATFLMSMTGRANKALRSEDALQTIEPGYTPPIKND
jgi:hypothetical protein